MKICMQEIYLGMFSGTTTEGVRKISRLGPREKTSADPARSAEAGIAFEVVLTWGEGAGHFFFLLLPQPVIGCRLLPAGSVAVGKVAFFHQDSSERN